MAEVFTVVIIYMDGAEERVDSVTHATVADGTLTLRHSAYGSLGFRDVHLGCFPIYNIRSWNQVTR